MRRSSAVLVLALCACTATDVISDETPTTSGGSTSEGPIGPGSSESTGAPSESSSTGAGSDDSTTTGATTGDQGSSTSSSGSESGSESSTGDAPDEPLVLDFDCCEPGCSATLEQGHPDVADVQIVGDRLLTHDVWVKSVLWDRTTRRPIRAERGAIWAGLGGDLFWTANLSTLRWFDANDGTLLGERDAGVRSGAAVDGSYLWLGTASGLTILDIDGTELWFEPGNFSAVNVRGLADRVYVLASYESLSSIRVIDLELGESTTIDFDGSFGGWFETGARWFAHEGLTYRVYDEGEELGFGLGNAMHGYEDYIVVDYGVRTIDAPNDVLATVAEGMRGSGAAIMSVHDDPKLVELLPEGVVETPIVVPPESPLWTFAYEAGEWIAAGNYGLLVDDEGNRWSAGRIEQLGGAMSERLVASSWFDTAYVWDLGECNATEVLEVAREPRAMALADDGTVLAETHFNGDVLGTRLLSLPDSNELGFLPGGSYEQSLRLSDDGSVVARWGPNGVEPGAIVESAAGDDVWAELEQWLPIYVAPNSAHAIAAEHDGTWMGPERTYVIDESGVVDVLDGLAYGFLDDDTLVVGRYESQICDGNFPCEVFLGADIVSLDGAIVQSTTLPEVPRFERVTSTEILVLDPPRIFDAHTGELLWMSEVEGLAAAVGADHVVVSDGGDLIVHRWR